MRRKILTGSFLLLLSSTAMAAQVYKWVDAQGNTHFGSQPPEGQQASQVNINTSQPKAPAPVPKKEVEDPAQEVADQKARDANAQQEIERKAFCDRSRETLAQLKATPRLRIEDKGELRRLTEDERQQRIKEHTAAIKENCL
ncbi:DUF4124 domain-containing protein [Pseudomonas sp. LRF_L74]|uniref:DUF4124 domain-containing protein n=1 Tax=Pseudomonas sp. LRF_L74 TaxID=3369422 RepID=UPI003F6402A2